MIITARIKKTKRELFIVHSSLSSKCAEKNSLQSCCTAAPVKHRAQAIHVSLCANLNAYESEPASCAFLPRGATMSNRLCSFTWWVQTRTWQACHRCCTGAKVQHDSREFFSKCATSASRPKEARKSTVDD